MIALLQRVSNASVRVGDKPVATIGPGLLVLLAVHRDDRQRDIARMAERIVGYRVFPDAEQRMNQCLKDIGGDLLLVPQFTLAADTKKGTRASFTRAAPPDMGAEYFDSVVSACIRALGSAASGKVETGIFGANMQVQLTNEGPVTFWLET